MTNWSKLHADAFRSVPVLVTGGAGFIGSHLTSALLSLGAQVTVIDNLSGADISTLAKSKAQFGSSLMFINGSIVDERILEKAMKGSRYVFHLAALGSVPRSVAEPVNFFENNVRGTSNVLEAAREFQVERIMFAASSSAYGDSVILPKVESMPCTPKSPYAATKVAGEALLMAYSSSYGLDTAPLRYFNIFGPYQNANSAYAAVIAGFAKAILSGERPTIYGDGEQSRDFTLVDNAVHANLLAARSPTPIGGRPINVAVGTRITVLELAQMMASALGRPDLTPVFAPERAGDVKHSLADLTRAKEILGYEPIVDFKSGLETTCKWYAETFKQ